MNETELLRWALADHAFRQADALTVHVMESKMEPGGNLYSACLTGIATCYFRPFVGAGGLGRIPEDIAKLETFKGEKFEEQFATIHRMLRETRVKIGGHYDGVFHQQLHEAGTLPERPNIVTLTLNEKGGTHVEINSIAMDPDNLRFVHGLCLLQISRVGTRIGTFGAELWHKNQGKPGTHVFKVLGDDSAGSIQKAGPVA